MSKRLTLKSCTQARLTRECLELTGPLLSLSLSMAASVKSGFLHSAPGLQQQVSQYNKEEVPGFL